MAERIPGTSRPPRALEGEMIRALAGRIGRALLVTCLGTAICSLAPATVQTLSAANSSPAGLSDDGFSHPPPATGSFAYNSFVPPGTQGASYVDPIFGSTVRRVTTDHSD